MSGPEIDAAAMRLYVMNSLLDTVQAHERDALQLPPWTSAAKRHDAAAAACYDLHDKMATVRETDPAFAEMAGIWHCTEGRCRKKDTDFFERLDYTARGYETARAMLGALLVNWRRVATQEGVLRHQR